MFGSVCAQLEPNLPYKNRPFYAARFETERDFHTLMTRLGGACCAFRSVRSCARMRVSAFQVVRKQAKSCFMYPRQHRKTPCVLADQRGFP